MSRSRFLLAGFALLVAGIAGADTVAIVGGKIHTVGPQGIIENGTIVVDDGRIVAVGAVVTVPDDATKIDAKGKVVTPGLFAPTTHIGLGEVGLSADPVDSAQSGEVFTASFDIADAYNPRATQVAITRVEGVTRAVILPRPSGGFMQESTAHVISGLGAVVHFGVGGDNVVRRAAALVVNLGAAGSAYAGGSRATALLKLRQAFDEAARYRNTGGAYDEDEYVYSANDLDAIIRVLGRRTPLLVKVHRASDIQVLLGLVDDYGVRAIISGGAEAWVLADELAAAGIAVILDPLANLPGDFDRLNARRGSAGVLADAGVALSFAESGNPSANVRNIAQLAGNAVADGMGWDDALRAITLAPAEMFGVAGSVGSIEVGKTADIVVWPGDPLELANFPDAVLINGESIPMVSRQTLLRDRYLQNQSGKPPAFRK